LEAHLLIGKLTLDDAEWVPTFERTAALTYLAPSCEAEVSAD
jgi:hypothetical protein